jgi:hypothetical protein
MVEGKAPCSPRISPSSCQDESVAWSVLLWARWAQNTINSEQYTDTDHEFLEQVYWRGNYRNIKQNVKARATMSELSLFFGDLIISKALWPPYWPDCQPQISPYAMTVKIVLIARNLYELKTNVSNITVNISPTALQAVTIKMNAVLPYVCDTLVHTFTTFCKCLKGKK